MMNKLTTLFVALLLTTTIGLKAQEVATGTPPSMYPILENKLKKSEKDLANPKKTAKAKYWLSRAKVMMDICNVNLQHLGKGAQLLQMKIMFGEPSEILNEVKEGVTYETHVHDQVKITYVDGLVDSYEEINKIHENPLPIAVSSLAKAEELDTDGKLVKKIKTAYDELVPMIDRAAMEAYGKDDFKKAFENFATTVAIREKSIMEGAVDTSNIFNTGLTASKAGLVDESIKYYEKALEYAYPEPRIYKFLYENYQKKDDTATAIDYLKKGFERYPEKEVIVFALINHYLLSGKPEEALELIKIAKESDPSNISLLFNEAALYDRSGEFEKALKVYKKCIELEPEYFDAHFNIGVLYYNEAQSVYKKADNPDISNDEYNAFVKSGDELLKSAIEPMVKCVELDPDSREALETLKSIYYRFKMMDKYDEVKAILDEMPAAEEAGGLN